MIELFAANTTIFAGRNGDVILLPSSCSVTARVNGTWELHLEHPLDPYDKWQTITTQSILRVPSHNGQQLFRIKHIEKTDSAVVADADPIFLDARNDCFILDTRVVNQTGQQALSAILGANQKYTGVSDIPTLSTAYYIRKNALEAINGSEDNSMLNRWGGEVEYDNFTIRVMQRLGSDTQKVVVRPGKNLLRDGLHYSVDDTNAINRIIPLSYNGHKMSGATPWVDHQLTGDAVVKTGVVTFEDIRLASDTGFSPGETVPSYITVCANQAALDTALAAAANDFFTQTQCYLPKVEIEAEIATLQSFEEYKEFQWIEQINLGDTVYLYNKRMGVGVDDQGEYDPLPIRVQEIEWDCIQDRADRIIARSEESSVSFSGSSASVGSSDSGFSVDEKGNVVMGEKLILGDPTLSVPTYLQKVPGNTNGGSLIVRPGASLVAGGGEYASARWGVGDIPLIGTGSEDAYLGAGRAVHIESNANTIANRKTWDFDESGNITTPQGGLINGVDITRLCNYDAVRTLSPTKTITSGTSWQNIMSFDLTPGLWLLEFTARFSSNATGYRGISISTSSGGSAQTYLLQDMRRAVSGSLTYCKITATYRAAANVTRYLNAIQNSGADLTFSMQYKLNLLKGE